jgi:conjugative relaxase-like TrwC/TraI family protein
MSLHRLSAGGGVDYLLKHTSCGDAERAADAPLSSYYVASGYPRGRWIGAGLAGIAGGRGIAGGVDEEAMTRLFGLGLDPVTSEALGQRWKVNPTAAQRIERRLGEMPADLDDATRASEIARIEAEENARKTPIAVSGFDLTFTLPKSASVLWALSDPATQTRIARAHGEAVTDCLRLLERHALFTRVGKNGIAQVPTRGAIAAMFDHWDTRTGDPNLHTHLVLANKVQGEDGRWRSIDSKALYAATVAISEYYDVIAADKIAAATGARWSVRRRDERSTLFEIDGVSSSLLEEFSRRSLQVEAALRELLSDFHARNNRSPTRPEMLRIRQYATRLSRPVKHLRPLPELLARWRERALALLPMPIEDWVTRVTSPRPRALRAAAIGDAQLHELARRVVEETAGRRSTWTRWNLFAEAARATKNIRMADTEQRQMLLETIVEHAITSFCLPLTPPDLTVTPQAFRRCDDGASAFRRHRAEVYTSPHILGAEDRLLAAARDTTGPAATPPAGHVAIRRDGEGLPLSADQQAATEAILTSRRRLDVLVGPAGSGKTTAMRALRDAWQAHHGEGWVVGLAPSATAARELATALGIECENTAKWIHETTGSRPVEREQKLAQLRERRVIAAAAGQVDKVAAIDAAGCQLNLLHQRFRLRSGQLLVIDEASLAGTLVLDELVRQADHAGAKVLLLGDHRQLSAVDAGGAFGLLATETGAAELTSLWRFTNRWEADATHRLRLGDAGVIDVYQAHDRLREGPAEVMAAHAYRGWAAALKNGEQALLIAADNHTVAALNDQAHTDRLVAGEVEAGGVRLHDGTAAGVGDIVVTRANNREVRTSSGAWVRNGDLWTVLARGHDGSLTLRRNQTATGAGARESTVTLAHSYVESHVELGYATTAHRAQGMTVDSAFTLLRPGMAREVAYVAMTRGRHANTAFIATDIPDHDYDGAPQPAASGPAILEQILTTQGAQLSATQTLRQQHHQAESLSALAAIHETLVQHAGKQRWQHALTTALPPGVAEQVLASPAYGTLVAAIRRAEHAHLPVAAALRSIATARPLPTAAGDDQTGSPGDPAAVLQWRINDWATAQHSYPRTPLLAGLFTPAADLLDAVSDPQLRAAITDLETRIKNRATAVTDQLIAEPPAWMRRLGPPPPEPRAHARWRAAVEAIAIYRDAYDITDATHPLGAAPPADPTQRHARRRALAAARAVVRRGNRPAAAEPLPSQGRTPIP